MKATKLLIVLSILCLPATMQAQETDDTKYLAGAVPENAEGKVVFSKTFNVSGMDQKQIYDRTLNWMTQRLAKNNNNSRVVLNQPEKGLIVGMGDEWIVFNSTFLSLDRTRILYQVSIEAQPQKCTLEVSKIRYIYREGEEKYEAEEWITDKYALNKKKTKLVRGLAKWRRHTVDFIEDMGREVSQALSITTVPTVETAAAPSAPVASVPVASVPAQQTAPATTLREINPTDLPAQAIQSGAGKIVLVVGKEPFNMTMMTANAGGSLGTVKGKPVVFTILSPEQSATAIENATEYVVRFYPNGAQEPTVVLECKKMESPAAIEGMPRTFIGEIVKAQVK